jgi:hypothetical protein
MARHQCIPLDAPSEWKAALQGIRHGVAYTWEYCNAMQMTTHMPTYLYCFEQDDTRIVCPISEREYGGYTDIVKPFGYTGFVGTGDCPDFQRYWAEFARQKGYVCGYLGVNPLFDNRSYYAGVEVYQYNSIFVVDLTVDAGRLFANLSKGRRHHLRGWDKLKESIVTDQKVLRTFLLDNYNEFVRRKGGSSFYLLSEATLAYLMDLDNVYMVGVTNGIHVEAAGLVAYTPDEGEELFFTSLPEGRQHTPVINWYTFLHLKELGVSTVNLGGGIHEDDGIAQYKQQLGSKKLPLRCIKQVFDADIYAHLCNQVGVDPSDMSGYFPAYRRP